MKRSNVADFICSLKRASQPAVSPDGRRVAYIVTETYDNTYKSCSNLRVLRIDGTGHRSLTSGPRNCSSPFWTHDGKAILYVDQPERESKSVFLRMPIDGGESETIASIDSHPGELSLSPDGTTLAFVAQYDPATSAPSESGLAPIRVVTRLDYKEDGYGIPNESHFQIHLLDIATGNIRRLTDSRHHHTALMWSPDGTKLGAIRQIRVGLKSQLLVLDIQSGEFELIGDPDHAVRTWAWSPGGESIVTHRSDHAEFGGDFYRLDIASGEELQLTNGFDWCMSYSVQTLTWIDNQHVVIHGYEQARSGLWKLDSRTGELERIQLYDAFHYGTAGVTGSGTVVQHRGSANESGELVAIDLAAVGMTPLTQLNTSWLADHIPGSIDEMTVENEGLAISYFLKKPHDFDPSRIYPLVFEIHGGPHMFRGFELEVSNQLFLDAGYLVVCPNPRGSLSYGLDFAKGVLGDWGGGDWRDNLTVVDAVAALPFVDSDRLGIYGYSYGGYMTSWAIGQTDRFRAAVIGAPLTDLISRDGTSDIGYAAPWLEYNGAITEIRDKLVAQSPVTHMHKAATPTLILHPEDDQRCPIGQGEQLFTGLMQAGVETQFVRYPGQSHLMPWTGPTEYRIDFYTRILDWFDTHL